MSIKFTNILRDLIVESSRFEVLFNKYIKPNKKTKKSIMDLPILLTIITADPTTKLPDGLDIDVDNVTPEKMEKVKIGKYSQWLLKNFTTPDLPADHPLNVLDYKSPQYKQAVKEYRDLFLEDLYKVTDDLKKYERFKNRLPQEYRDINKLTPSKLYDQVKDFSLEKTKATADEKKQASITYEHPGADIVYRGSDWTVARISDTGQLGKNAACFYGGSHQDPSKGETRWCTSSPGLSWFDRYIKDGPLYVVIPNNPAKFSSELDTGQTSGLPAKRYQFHFPSNQFMDPADRQINLVTFLSENEPGLKEFFRPEFAKGLVSKGGDKVTVNYPSDSASKFLALYGFDDFFKTLPQNLKRLEFTNKSGSDRFDLTIPESVGNFKDLSAIHLVGCVSKVPESICDLKELKFLSLPDNPNLERLPECLADLPKLSIINIRGSKGGDNVPEKLRQKAEENDNFFIFE